MADLTHAQLTRMIYIDGRLVSTGRLNRSDITSAFSLSVPLAVSDIQAYRQINPDRIEYDSSAKAYLVIGGSSPAYPAALRMAVATAVNAVASEMRAAPHA